jgi:hypothetical protein
MGRPAGTLRPGRTLVSAHCPSPCQPQSCMVHACWQGNRRALVLPMPSQGGCAWRAAIRARGRAGEAAVSKRREPQRLPHGAQPLLTDNQSCRCAHRVPSCDALPGGATLALVPDQRRVLGCMGTLLRQAQLACKEPLHMRAMPSSLERMRNHCKTAAPRQQGAHAARQMCQSTLHRGVIVR